MKLTTLSVILFALLILNSLCWNGCYTQLAFDTDETTAADNPNQPSQPIIIIVPTPYPEPIGGPWPYPPDPQPIQPVQGPVQMPPQNPVTAPPVVTPPREPLVQRPYNPNQSGGRNQSQTSWSPAPSSNDSPGRTPANRGSDSDSRTGGSPRR